MMALATGSDYGGSVRTPAGFCGVAGFRPSPGVIPAEDRPVSLSPFSVLGPMARNVTDLDLCCVPRWELTGAILFLSR